MTKVDRLDYFCSLYYYFYHLYYLSKCIKLDTKYQVLRCVTTYRSSTQPRKSQEDTYISVEIGLFLEITFLLLLSDAGLETEPVHYCHRIGNISRNFQTKIFSPPFIGRKLTDLMNNLSLSSVPQSIQLVCDLGTGLIYCLLNDIF